MMPSYLDYQSSRWDDAYQVKPIDCRNCSVVLLGPYSYLGSIYSPLIIDACQQVCAVVDDQSKDEKIFGITKWSSDEFRTRAGRVKDLVAVDLSCSPMGNAVFGRLIEAAGVERVDLVQILAELNLPAVYQTPEVMRELTIARQSDWYALRNSFEDAQSRRTLDAILLLRLTFDRRCLRQVTTSLEDEYFSVYDSRATFTLRDDEVICDAGAYIGSTVRKAVSAGSSLRAIHAFEPDRGSFSQLQNLAKLRLSGLHLHNSAVGDYTGKVRFLETGTMGSHVVEDAVPRETEIDGSSGDGNISITRLDDTMDEVTFIKMDLEGFERRAINGAARLIESCRPRMAITGYHYADDLLDIARTIRDLAPDYTLRLRHHSNYYYDSILYAAPREDPDSARYFG
jgi:FkbM family methyltransferase